MALKYLKDIEINIYNILIITGDFNISNSNWNPFYSYNLIYSE